MTIAEFGNDAPYFGLNGGNLLLYATGAQDPTVLTLNTWIHVACTYDGTNTVLYVNGIQVATGATPIGIGGAGMGIGRHSGDVPFNGKIDEFRVWNDVRTGAEILANMCDLPAFGAEANLVAYYKFDQASGSTTLTDLTGSHTGSLTNMDVSQDWQSGVCLNMAYETNSFIQHIIQTTRNCDNSNIQMAKLKVVTHGHISPLTLTQIQLNLNGSTNSADVSNIDIYYTGDVDEFSTATLFNNQAGAGGAINFNGSQALLADTNYFWIVYDLAGVPTLGNVLDIECANFTVGGVGYIPAVTAPGGNRFLETCTSVPGNVTTGKYSWYASNKLSFLDAAATTQSFDGSDVSNWKDMFNSRDLSVTSHNAPATFNGLTSEMNYNPSLLFGGPSCLARGGYSFNTTATPTDGTIYFVMRPDELAGFNTVLGFSLNDADDPLLGTTGVSFVYYHDNEGVQSHSRTATLNESYILTYHWTTGTNGMNLAINGQDEFNATANGRNFGGYFMIGAEDGIDFATLEEVYIGKMPEAILYNTKHVATDRIKIESYLALKFGITLGANGTSMDYINGAGTVVWNQGLNSGYAFDIAGLMRDDDGQLYQNKAHSTNSNGTNYNDIVTIAKELILQHPLQLELTIQL